MACLSVPGKALYYYGERVIMIYKEMRVLDIVEKYPECQEVFHRYDEKVGACIMCEQLFNSLAEMSVFYGLEIENIISELEKAIIKK
jgi:hypothetical protein